MHGKGLPESRQPEGAPSPKPSSSSPLRPSEPLASHHSTGVACAQAGASHQVRKRTASPCTRARWRKVRAPSALPPTDGHRARHEARLGRFCARSARAGPHPPCVRALPSAVSFQLRTIQPLARRSRSAQQARQVGVSGVQASSEPQTAFPPSFPLQGFNRQPGPTRSGVTPQQSSALSGSQWLPLQPTGRGFARPAAHKPFVSSKFLSRPLSPGVLTLKKAHKREPQTKAHHWYRPLAAHASGVAARLIYIGQLTPDVLAGALQASLWLSYRAVQAVHAAALPRLGWQRNGSYQAPCVTQAQALTGPRLVLCGPGSVLCFKICSSSLFAAFHGTLQAGPPGPPKGPPARLGASINRFPLARPNLAG